MLFGRSSPQFTPLENSAAIGRYLCHNTTTSTGGMQARLGSNNKSFKAIQTCWLGWAALRHWLPPTAAQAGARLLHWLLRCPTFCQGIDIIQCHGLQEPCFLAI